MKRLSLQSFLSILFLFSCGGSVVPENKTCQETISSWCSNQCPIYVGQPMTSQIYKYITTCKNNQFEINYCALTSNINCNIDSHRSCWLPYDSDGTIINKNDYYCLDTSCNNGNDAFVCLSKMNGELTL